MCLRKVKKKLTANKIFLIIILFAVFFRVWDINSESYWFDETVTLQQAQMPYLKGMESLKHDTQLPLYLTLLSGWVHVFGVSEISSRSLSAIFGVLSVFVIFLLGKKLFNERVGLYSAVILTFSSIAIFYSQESRPYSLFILLTLLSFYFYFGFIEKKSVKNAVWYFLFSLLMIYTHWFAFLSILVQNLYYFYENRKNVKNLFHWCGLQLCLGLLFLPWLPMLFIQTKNVSQVSWIPKPNILIVYNTFYNFFGNKSILLIFVFLLLVFLFRKKIIITIKESENRNLVILFMWALLPMAIVLAYSLFFRPLYLTRYFLFTLPAYYVLFAYFVSKASKKRTHQIIIMSVIVVLSVISIVEKHNTVDKTDWRGASLFIKNNIKPEDFIFICYSHKQLTFTFYYDKECFSEPSVYSCNLKKNKILSTNNENELKDYLQEPVWLVAPHPSRHHQAAEQLFNYFNESKELILSRDFEGGYFEGKITVYKFE